jgi:hypothetical protein
MGRGGKTRMEVGAPVAGVVLRQGGKEEGAQAQLYPVKMAGRGWLLEAPLTMKWVTMVEAVEAPAVRGSGAAHRRQNDGLSFRLRRRAQTWLASTTAEVGAALVGRRRG